jgi:hypothetical protein
MALPAGDFTIGGFWSGFYFNNLKERFAVRAEEQWLAGRHRRAPASGVTRQGDRSAADAEWGADDGPV